MKFINKIILIILIFFTMPLIQATVVYLEQGSLIGANETNNFYLNQSVNLSIGVIINSTHTQFLGMDYLDVYDYTAEYLHCSDCVNASVPHPPSKRHNLFIGHLPVVVTTTIPYVKTGYFIEEFKFDLRISNFFYEHPTLKFEIILKNLAHRGGDMILNYSLIRDENVINSISEIIFIKTFVHYDVCSTLVCPHKREFFLEDCDKETYLNIEIRDLSNKKIAETRAKVCPIMVDIKDYLPYIILILVILLGLILITLKELKEKEESKFSTKKLQI